MNNKPYGQGPVMPFQWCRVAQLTSRRRTVAGYFGICILNSFGAARFSLLSRHILGQRAVNELLKHPGLLSLPEATAGMRGTQIPPPNKPLDDAVTFKDAQERAALLRASELHLQDLRRAHGRCRLKGHGAVTGQ